MSSNEVSLYIFALLLFNKRAFTLITARTQQAHERMSNKALLQKEFYTLLLKAFILKRPTKAEQRCSNLPLAFL